MFGDADAVIVGGGFTGMSAALHLARSGVHPIVLEASVVGDGASGRTGGLVLEGIATGIREGARDCVPSLARVVDELGIECDLRLPGCWEIEHQQGAPALPWCDEGAPVRIARTVIGGNVEPRALLFGLARGAAAAGAVICEHVPVRRLVLDADMPAVELDDGIVHARNIVVSVNAWTSALIPDLPPIHSALTYACATEPLTEEILHEIGLGERIPFYTVDMPYLWGRVAAAGSVVFGSGLTYGPPQRLEDVDVGAGPARATLARLEARIHKLHPRLADVQIVARWGGPIAFTEDAVPILGACPDAPHVFVAGAYAGHGVAFSVHAGAAIARAITESVLLPRWGALSR